MIYPKMIVRFRYSKCADLRLMTRPEKAILFYIKLGEGTT
jgi:hypothetical protein